MRKYQRIFDSASQERFARLSRDYNPIHMDPIAARRTHSGAPIVHGIHSMIWMLDCLATDQSFVPGTGTLRVQFLQPIYVGDDVTLEISSSPPKGIRARLAVGPEDVVLATLSFEEVQRPALPPQHQHSLPIDPPDSPANLELQQMQGLGGSVAFAPMLAEVGRLFPSAVEMFGARRIAALVCSSCVVGMLVPGLHSLYSGLDVSLTHDGVGASDALRFAVLSVTPRFRLVRIGVEAPGLRGSLETVSRMPPVRQPPVARILPLLGSGEFSDTTALVIGGSRGLGELTAKLIAAGGGQVIITYSKGKADADAVVSELVEAGLHCRAISYDVLQPAAQQLATLDTVPSHFYYFATPAIFRRRAAPFDRNRFEEFNAFYVTAFCDLVQTALRLRPTGIKVFYPSSSALDTRPATMTEYSMSKAAAEILCTDLSKFVPGVRIVTRRLPRLSTDQTSSIVQEKVIDAIDVLLPIIRGMHEP